MPFFSRWFSTSTICVDFGSYSTKVSLPPHKTIIEIPNVAAVDTTTGDVVALGQKARDLIGRAPQSVEIVYPVAENRINDDVLLAQLVQQAVRSHRRFYDEIFGYNLLMSLGNNVDSSGVELLHSVAGQIDASQSRFISESIAGLIGSSEISHDSATSLVVNIGHEKTTINTVAGGSVVSSSMLKTGGAAMEQAIKRRVEDEHDLVISDHESRDLKESAVSFGGAQKDDFRIFGQDVSTRLPREQKIKSELVIAAASPIIENIAEESQNVLKKSSPDLASEIFQHGVHVVGGCAHIPGLSDYFSEALTVPVHISAEPHLAVIRGLQQNVSYFQSADVLDLATKDSE